MSKKLISKLNPKIPNPDSCGGSSHGALSSHDIAAALGRCHNPISAPLLRVKYAGDRSSLGRLSLTVLARVAELVEENNWKTEEPMRFVSLAAGACDEYLNKLCTMCDGRGTIGKRAATTKQCPMCEGSGKYKPKASERARTIGVTATAYKTTWAPRWDSVLEELSKAEGEGAACVSHQLK
jgi:hypothetical protein